MSLLIRFFGVYSDGKIEQSLAVVTAHLPAVEISSVWLFHPISAALFPVLCGSSGLGGLLGHQGGEFTPNPCSFT